MKNIAIIIVGIVLVFIVGFYALNSYIYNEKQGVVTADYKDAEYVIGGDRVKLEDGVAEKESAPGSASKVVTKYFGNEVKSDLDSDGREDVIFLLTQETGGGGVFYYVVAGLNTERGYVGSEALLLGDRIVPQTTEKGKGKIVIVNYSDRKPGEDFVVKPSVGKSIWLLLDPVTMQFGEVEQNFEGEANPEVMTLNMKTWNWISALYEDGREILPKKSGKFTLSFSSEDKFSATTDCNSMGGSYKVIGNLISFSQIASTKMYCEDSQESDFASFLINTSGYHFTSRGELVLSLKFDSGSVVFR